MDPALEKLAQAEERKVAANPGYRTSARMLRRLSKAHVVYELPSAERGAFDRFAMRHIGFAIQRRMARDFAGDAEAMREACVDKVSRQLGLAPSRLRPNESKALSDFTLVLNLVPDLARWSKDEKSALREIIAAKAGRTEQRYQRLVLNHERLRRAILRMGSPVG